MNLFLMSNYKEFSFPEVFSWLLVNMNDKILDESVFCAAFKGLAPKVMPPIL